MSRFIAGISGALALSLISGAAEFARGRDLAAVAGNHTPSTQSLSLSSGSPSKGGSVNRGSKADRVAALAGSPASTQTVSLKLDAFSDTTFLVRIPVAASNRPAARAPAGPAIRKPMVACEPMVSPLTEVAKQLQPGRCVA
jgi:hypothetical protein